ncbi:RHS repeat-associated core domain-containing protein, partial [Xanthomonas perforans]|uniref:RHS repeat-associated core domain-containing protein n=12 Tax=Xanthomonas TaxID=338 RepID=UPI000A8FE58B
AFGNTAPNQDPDGDGAALVLDMRFPGQRFDAASGLNQNYFRDYEAATGRYGQSDPIGFRGGIGTYVYGRSSPFRWSDKLGLLPGD